MLKSLKRLVRARVFDHPSPSFTIRGANFFIILQTIEKASLHRYTKPFLWPLISGFFGSFRVLSGKPATNPLPIGDADGPLLPNLSIAKLNSTDLIFQNIFSGHSISDWPFLRLTGNSDRYGDSRFGNEERKKEDA